MQDLCPCVVSADSEISRTWIVPGLLSSVHGQLGGRGLLNPGYNSLTCTFSPENGSEHIFSPWAVSKHSVTEPLLLMLPTKPLQNAPTTEQFSLLGIAVSRPMFSKRMSQKSCRLQCAILATVFETSWLKGWMGCSERWPLHPLYNGI